MRGGPPNFHENIPAGKKNGELYVIGERGYEVAILAWVAITVVIYNIVQSLQIYATCT